MKQKLKEDRIEEQTTILLEKLLPYFTMGQLIEVQKREILSSVESAISNILERLNHDMGHYKSSVVFGVLTKYLDTVERIKWLLEYGSYDKEEERIKFANQLVNKALSEKAELKK